jgi:hypothetical protein
MSTDIPNRIKQPTQCCIHCGKSYKKKNNLHNHVIVCELLHNSKNKTTIEENDEIPSQKKLYQILLELGNKFNKLEEKIDEINKWVVKKKKKINVIEWLNKNITPEIKFESLIEKIIINEEDIDYLFNNSFGDTLNHIFARNIYNNSESEYPIFAFVQKANIFYIYENEEAGWMELNREKLVKFLNKVHMKLLRVFLDWKKENSLQVNNNEKLSILCDKTSLKMMSVDFRQESILSKIKNNIYSRMKTDMKELVEYEFEF